jgi:uncharacterized protein
MLALLGAVAIGAAFGYGAQRGALCMNSGFRNVLDGDWIKVKALALAVAVQLIVLPAVFATGLARTAQLPLSPLAAVVGGVVFGLSMRWAGGCAAGVWYKLGAGDVGALFAILGMALGATALDAGPLAALRIALQSAGSPSLAWSPTPLLSVGAGLLLLAATWRWSPGRAGAWTWRRTGTLVGITAALAWPLSAAAGRDFGLAIMPGTTGLLAFVTGNAFSAWDALLVLGVMAGGWLAARHAGPLALNAPNPAGLVKRFVGGLGLGMGASMASGCTVGQGLTGLALLAPSSFIVMAAIFSGSALATVMGRRPAHTPAPVIPSAAHH